MNRRDALIQAGLAKPGRGKFSTAANAWLAKEREKGVVFDDDNVPARPVKVEGKPAAPVVQHPGDSLYISPSDFRFPESEYKAVEVGGKTHSMRECCNNCRVSLTNHSCDRPSVHGNIVTIVRK